LFFLTFFLAAPYNLAAKAAMKLIDYYYLIKPVIPRRIQLFLRRAIAARKRKLAKDFWPISPGAAQAPNGWRGWPEKKRFAFILKHDVDTVLGLKNCLKLMNVEKKLNFRSSFNFVAEDYFVLPSLRQSLNESGFEVGIHGLKHDGKLFINRKGFEIKARRINIYLKEWNAVGFTSPSMLRNHEWMTDFDIDYACSTFDTDPFEPQSKGMHTIFPFFVTSNITKRTYVEIPYTLPQDHGLFIILREKDNNIWKQKLDWIAENGGMALLNTHPDYMNFEETSCFFEQYPVSYYTDLLEYIETNYVGQYWHVLPRELARFWKSSMLEANNIVIPEAQNARPRSQEYGRRQKRMATTRGVKIWIDLDNTPHVPFFIPIVHELERRGHQVVLSARDAFQVCELANEKGLRYTKIGHHYGKNPFMKVFGLLWRSAQLMPFCLRQRPGLALSHGSRSQILLCNLLRLPTVEITDYEYARTIPLARPRWEIVPEALLREKLYWKPKYVRYYNGIKEDVYVPEFKPDLSLLAELGLRHDEMIITVRPPANEAHYYNPESDVLLVELMSRICGTPRVRAVLLPRNHAQELAFRANYPEWFKDGRTIVPPRAVDGLDLIWLSDLVVSGGGTMNREAAALGVPVYSIFRGKTGAVDRRLEQEGLLTLIKSAEEVWTRIPFTRRDNSRPPSNMPRPALDDIVNYIEEIIQTERVHP
jgi:predicted glycosyltransferase